LCSRLSLRAREPAASQPPQDPAQRAKLPGEIANAQRHAAHSREASTAFSEACTAYLRILSRIGANVFEHFRRAALRSAPSSSRCQRDMSLRICSHRISARRTLRCRRNGPSRCIAVMSHAPDGEPVLIAGIRSRIDARLLSQLPAGASTFARYASDCAVKRCCCRLW